MCKGEIMEEKLKEIFDYVNKWLNFAEAKNGAIIVLNGACIIGLLSMIFGTEYSIQYWLKIYLFVSVILLILSTGVSLFSFFPMTSKFNDENNKNLNQSPILLFYGDIAKFNDSRQFVTAIYKEYLNNSSKTINDITKLEEDYAKEIIYNSRITVRKYMYFKISLILTMSAFISLPVVIIAYAILGICKTL